MSAVHVTSAIQAMASPAQVRRPLIVQLSHHSKDVVFGVKDWIE